MQAANLSRRAHQCVKCRDAGVNVIDRKDRVIHHVLKYHVPLDEAPHFCRLCMFRAMKESQLKNHVSAYQKHVKLARERQILDHRPYLCTSKKPKVMTEEDVTMLSKEASKAYFMQREKGTGKEQDVDFYTDLEGNDSMTEEEETPIAGLSNIPPRQTQSTIPNQSSVLQQLTSKSFGSSSAASNSYQPAFIHVPRVDTTMPIYNPTPLKEVGRNLDHSFVDPISPGQTLIVPNPSRVLDPSDAQNHFRTLDMPTLESIMWSPRVAAPLPQVTQPTSTVGSRGDETNTPLQEDILPQLLQMDKSDPLAIETGLARQRKHEETGCKQQSPPKKRGRREVSPDLQTPLVDFSPVLKVLSDSTAAIVEAIDRNSRAIRCQRTALESLVEEVKDINRNLRDWTSQQRIHQRKATPPRQRSPAVKSSVHRPRK